MCRNAAARRDAKLFEFVERFIECGEETKAMGAVETNHRLISTMRTRTA